MGQQRMRLIVELDVNTDDEKLPLYNFDEVVEASVVEAVTNILQDGVDDGFIHEWDEHIQIVPAGVHVMKKGVNYGG